MARDLKKLKRQLARQKGAPGIGAPMSLTLDYFRALDKYSRDIADIMNDTVIKALSNYDRAFGLVQDNLGSDLSIAWQSFINRTAGLSSKRLALDVFKKTADGINTFQRGKFIANIKNTIGVDVGVILREPNTQRVISEAVANNIRLISSISDSYRERAERIIRQALTGGSDFASLKNELLELGGFKKGSGSEIRRARLIARDQTQKLMGAINEARQVDNGITHYFWDTANDQRVRPSHEANDGKRFAWASPPPTGHPGEDVNCRCVARPDLSAFLERT